MTNEHDPRPWESLEEIAQAGDAQQLEQFIESLPTAEAVRAISRLDAEDQNRVLTTLQPEQAAELLEECPQAEAREMIEQLPATDAAAILAEMASDEQADLITGLSAEDAEAIFREMAPDEAAEARELASYATDEAGGIMVTEYLSYPESFSASQVVDDLRRNAEKYADYDVQYVYIVSPFGDLVGVLRLRDLLLSRPNRSVADMMIRRPIALNVHSSLDELVELFDSHAFFGVPVIDRGGKLVGVVRRSDVDEAIANRADQTFLKSQGIVAGEELRTMSVKSRAWRRGSWLCGNLVLDLIAVSVIAYYQDTLSAVIALAVFLPVISDMSGNAGTQAVAISLREMTLGLLKPTEILWVCMKEVSVGIINGVVLGALMAAVVWLYAGNPWLALVIGVAMAINTVVAVTVGGMLPMFLKRMKWDPALSSGPILTTITDMFGFFLVLSMATLALAKLT